MLREPRLELIDSDDPPIGLSNHIIVCGEHESIHIFVRSLRRKYISRVIPVVILSEAPLPVALIQKVERYPEVYFMLGNPLDREDLKTCQVKYADKAVIYSKLEFEGVDEEPLSKDHQVL